MKLSIFLPVFLSLPVTGALASECLDTGVQGDGWGWDGQQSCRIDISPGECIDFDGDGWGWNGVESCLTNVQTQPGGQANVQPTGVGANNDVDFAVQPTGQTTSYTIGDDGDQNNILPSGSGRFTDNGNGSFTDTITGLTWLGVRQCITEQTWSDAIGFSNQLGAASEVCPALNDGSSAGEWRLPNINELRSIVDYSQQSPAFVAGIPFSGTWDGFPWGHYWSSTSFIAAPDQNAWIVDSSFGQVSVRAKSNLARTFAVRD